MRASVPTRIAVTPYLARVCRFGGGAFGGERVSPAEVLADGEQAPLPNPKLREPAPAPVLRGNPRGVAAFESVRVEGRCSGGIRSGLYRPPRLPGRSRPP